MYGGVGGVEPRGFPLSRFCAEHFRQLEGECPVVMPSPGLFRVMYMELSGTPFGINVIGDFPTFLTRNNPFVFPVRWVHRDAGKTYVC